MGKYRDFDVKIADSKSGKVLFRFLGVNTDKTQKKGRFIGDIDETLYPEAFVLLQIHPNKKILKYKNINLVKKRFKF